MLARIVVVMMLGQAAPIIVHRLVAARKLADLKVVGLKIADPTVAARRHVPPMAAVLQDANRIVAVPKPARREVPARATALEIGSRKTVLAMKIAARKSRANRIAAKPPRPVCSRHPSNSRSFVKLARRSTSTSCSSSSSYWTGAPR